MYLNVFSIIRRKTKRFRPLIRGFFFYVFTGIEPTKNQQVSVPLFGDSFFIITDNAYMYIGEIVSVPLFGDSFFILSL